jgi:hypothetical protein
VLNQQAIPEDLAEIPPGSRLSAALAGLDVARLSGFDCVEVLKARYRQLNHDRAQLMVAGPAHVADIGTANSAIIGAFSGGQHHCGGPGMQQPGRLWDHRVLTTQYQKTWLRAPQLTRLDFVRY